MRPITPEAPLHVGDVLHHPAFGFAHVESVDEGGANVRWERAGPNHPVHVTAAGLADAYRRCDPRGLLARSVENLEATRALLTREPLTALALLLVDLGGKQRREDLRDWLSERRLVGDGRFDDWWSAVAELLPGDGRFVVKRNTLALADGIGYPQVSSAQTTPLPPPGTLPAVSAFAFAIRLSRALAEAHARGACLDGERTAISLSGAAGVALRTRPSPGPARLREDVRVVMRTVLEQVLGPLPSSMDLADDELTALVGSVDPVVPFELLGVTQEALATNPDLRPADGLALLARLTAASATHELRLQMPHHPSAAAIVGFNSHIGTVKSLQGQTNQDAFLVVGEPQLAMVAVADGISLSSAGSGDLAAQLFARSMVSWWEEHGRGLAEASPGKVHAMLAEGLRRANRLICEQALRLAGGDLERHVPMGTTAILAVTRGNRVHLVGLGDSRAYVVGPHGVSIVSSDLNLESLRLHEALSGREVEWDEPRHSLTSYLGHFTMDGRVEMAPSLIRTFTLLPDEWLILASDGLTDYAADQEALTARRIGRAVREAVGHSPGARAMDLCRRLVDLANRGGGGDNITVLALTLSAEEGAPLDEEPLPS